MTDKFIHLHLNDIEYDMDAYSIINKIKAEIVDVYDDVIVQACIDAAKEEGIHDLYLLDKKFVMDALREKIQRTKQEY